MAKRYETGKGQKLQLYFIKRGEREEEEEPGNNNLTHFNSQKKNI